MKTKEQKIERLKIEKKRKYLFEDLGNLEYQRYANIKFYGHTEDSETIKEIDNLIKQKEQQLKELEDDTKKSR